MKEKVIVVSDKGFAFGRNIQEINNLLEHGWSVKSVTSAATNDYVTSVFVLQKSEE